MLQRRFKCSHGFTLVELLISIGLVLVLMIGIATVFKMTGDTVGTNQAIAEAVRGSRSAQSVFYRDLGAAVTSTDSPCIIIQGSRASAYRDRADEQGDRDANPLTVDLSANNVEGDAAGETIAPAVYNSRSHRTDIFSFFARAQFSRQTGADNTVFVSPLTSPEAWIWYGHLRLPNNAGAFSATTDPGQGTSATNPNNYYASQWTLGRSVTLLSATAPAIGSIGTTAGIVLSPLAAGSQESPSLRLIQESRYDVARTTIQAFGALTTANLTAQYATMIYRFNANPFVSKPLTADGVAQTVPLFLSNCTQFIVEYAGDFVTQDVNGLVTANVPDQTTDFWQDPAVTYTSQGIWAPGTTYAKFATVTYNGVLYASLAAGNVGQQPNTAPTWWTPFSPFRKTRWYGLPRNTYEGDDTTSAPVIRGTPLVAGNGANGLFDVVPLRDTTVGGVAMSFERVIPTNAADYVASMPANAVYTCAWAPGDTKPKMIRITITVADSNGRLPDGQTNEYVFNLP